LLDFSDRRGLRELAEVVGSVQRAANPHPMMIAGATARDLLLLHACGIDTVRATNDVDVAVSVPDWDSFRRLRESLLATPDFTKGRTLHTFSFRGLRVDVVPFGSIESGDRTIAWPPHGDQVMTLLGFSEALLSAVVVRLPEGVETKVVSLPAMIILKLVAWQDRRFDAPGKDAGDLWLLLRNYADAGNEPLIYDNCITVLEATQFDVPRSGAWLLGSDARRVIDAGADPARSIAAVRAILDPEIDPEGSLKLVSDMPVGEKDRQLELLSAFHAGFVGVTP
jgi:predicted nucleotidyltransferase